MKNLSCKFWLLFVLVLLTCTYDATGQSNKDVTVYKEGPVSEAIHASVTPDNRTVGVYLVVSKGNELPAQEWATTIGKYFEAYGFPVKIIIDAKPPEGKGAIARIYIAGKACQGNLSSGNFGVYHILNNHHAVFRDLLNLYKSANPDLFKDSER